MNKTVCFRAFEERDIDFVHRCKNDDKLNSMVVGQTKRFDYQQAVDWVHGCMVDNPKFRFWAVCTNDEERRIVGWTAISNVDLINRSAFFYSIVIGDAKYRNGIPWIEVQQFVISYVFEELNLNRLEFTCLSDHHSSMAIGPVWFFEQEGEQRQAVYKNGKYHNVSLFALLREDYQKHKDNGEYDFMPLLSRYANYSKKNK